ncbi:MAG: alanine racemase [Nitrospinales bacterium]|jgi:alanine racemase
MAHHRATFAEINLKAFKHNLQNLKTITKPATGISPATGIMAVIKADAYGHGALPCAKAAVDSGVDYLGAGIIEEGIELRENGIIEPILILGSIFPDEVADLVRHDLATILCTPHLAQALSKEAEKQGKTVNVHIKVDTGMNRLGVLPENLLPLIKTISDLPTLKLEAISTHFSSADDEDKSITTQQIELFQKTIIGLQEAGVTMPPLTHLANTSALLRFPESRSKMVRPGLILYGALPSPVLNPVVEEIYQKENLQNFQPVMQWKSKIILLKSVQKGQPLSYSRKHFTQKNSLIATLPLGYADGLHRNLSNNMEVLVKGKRAPQVGTICMDMILIDVTEVPDVQMGDEVVIFGKQGEEEILVEELAKRSNTIPYEILCNVGKRVPRIYHG